MHNRLSKLAVAAGSAALLSTGALATAPKPASAQISTGTVNTILGAAALVGGIILYNNYVHKKQQANTVVGYTGNGGQVMGDGRVVFPNGQTVYPNSNGQYPWGQYAYYSPHAREGDYRYDYEHSHRYEHHDNGRHEGWYKEHREHHEHHEHHDRDHDGD
jgi:hypothetical protein